MKRRRKSRKWGEASPNTVPALESAYWTDAPVADLCQPPSAVAPRPAVPLEPAVPARVPATYRKIDAPVCRVPGCRRRLHRENRLGLCRWHNHAVGYCPCPKCAGRTT